jgi:hypothetical protein
MFHMVFSMASLNSDFFCQDLATSIHDTGFDLHAPVSVQYLVLYTV